MIRARKKTTLRRSVFFWALTYSFISSSSGIISMVISAVIFLGLRSPGFSMQISYNDEALQILGKCRVFTCDPVGIQTQDLQNRNLTLYSAKLRGQSECKGSKIIPNSLTVGPINVAEPCFFDCSGRHTMQKGGLTRQAA